MSLVRLSLLSFSVLGVLVACGSQAPGSGDDSTGGDGDGSSGGDGNVNCLAPPCEQGVGGTGAGAGTGGNGVATGGVGTGGGPTGGAVGYDCNQLENPDAYAFDAVVPPSQMPPGGLAVADTPLFVAIGFDDNPASSGMAWTTDMLNSQGVGSTFFHTSSYAPDALDQWKTAFDAGYEVALHTVGHATSYQTDYSTWDAETAGCLSTLTGTWGAGGLGVPRSKIYGSRAPFLEYNDEYLTVLTEQGVWYDSTIQEGYDPSQDGTNYYYPYTLEAGSPGHTYNKAYGFIRSQFDLTPHPGLMELPVYALLAPPDSEAEAYGFTPGLRSRIDIMDFVGTGYKITGFDYNLWIQGGVTGAEFLAILKYNFDRRRAGNRAPFIFGTHTDLYSESTERRQALTDFITYVKTFPEVRVVSYKELFDFMRNPRALSCD